MKLCTINVVNDVGSTGRIAASLCRNAKVRGDACLFLYGRGGAPSDIPSYRVGNDSTLLLHAALSRLSDRQGFYSRRATALAMDEIRTFDPDIIHLHNVHGYYLNMPVLFHYLRTCGKPVVWTLHDCWPFTGHCAYFDAAGCDRYKTGCHDCPEKHVYPKSLLCDRSQKNYAEKRRLFSAVPGMMLVTPSKWLAGLARQSFLQECAIRVVPNGIDLSVFHPVESGLRARYGMQEKTLLLGVAQVWDRRKGLDTFFSLRKLLPSQYAIVLIGLADEQIQRLPAGVIGIPRTKDANELAAWYTAADVFVDCTHEENFPTTHLEALACGTPVVTFAAGGSAEMLTERCGISVPVDDIGRLQHAIIEAGAFAPEDCCSRAAQYSKAHMIDEYLALYDRLLGREGQ